jgi:Lon protease-like protein
LSSFQELPLFPLNTVLFPGMVLPLHIFEERYKVMMNHCISHEQPFGVLLIREGLEVGGTATVFDVGTAAQITQIDQLEDGRMNIASLGINRFKLIDLLDDSQPYLMGLVEEYPFAESDTPAAAHEADVLSPVLNRYLTALAKVGRVNISLDQIPNDATTLAFLSAIVLRAPLEEKQNLLSQASLVSLLRRVKSMLKEEIEVINLLSKSAPKWYDEPSLFSPN